MTQEEILEKAMTSTALFSGGALNPTQQKNFSQLVKDFSTMLPLTRFIDMPTTTYNIDKMHVGEPITFPVGEDSDTMTNPVRPAFQQLVLTAEKTSSHWYITTEALQQNIEQEGFEASVMESFTKRIATDFEIMAISGDKSLAPGATPLEKTRSRLDGWDKLTDDAHIVDIAGASISTSTWANMIRKMPENYLQDPDMRWFVPRAVATDWMETISTRQTNVGDDALKGNSITPFGIPMVVVPLIPTNKNITYVTGALPAKVVATEFGPYEIRTGANDQISINVNGDGIQTLVIAQGTYTALELGAAIVVAWDAVGTPGLLKGYDNGEGNLVLQTVAVGASPTAVIIIGAIANDMYTEVGLIAGTTNGAAAGSNTVQEGTFIWLANPKNFIFGMLDQTRLYSEFDKKFDRVETVIINQVAAQVENKDAIVKAVNVRKILA